MNNIKNTKIDQDFAQRVSVFLQNYYGKNVPVKAVPNRDEEAKLFDRLYRDQDDAVRNVIISRFLYSVGEIAFTVASKTISQDAAVLISEANAEMIRLLTHPTLRFDPSQSRFTTYLFLRVRAALLNFIRVEKVVSGTKNRKSPEVQSIDLLELQLAEVAFDPESDKLDDSIWNEFLHKLLKQLPERDRTVAKLLFMEQRSTRDVAELYEVSRQAVYNWKHEILTALHDLAKGTDLYQERKDRQSPIRGEAAV